MKQDNGHGVADGSYCAKCGGQGMPLSRRHLNKDLKKECHREENGQCKGPETGVCLVCSRNNKDSSEAGVK